MDIGKDGRFVEVSIEKRIATVMIDAFPANALNDRVLNELEACFYDLQQRDLAAIILTGKLERFFCAGANIKGFLERTPEENQRYFAQIYRVLSQVENCKHPVVAAINGYAMGAGLELALCADIRIADERAKLGATGVNLGLVFCTQRLPRLIGEGRARELLFTARVLEAVEAEKIGLVEHLAPTGKSLERAREIAGLIAKKAPLAVQGVKQAMNQGQDQILEEALQTEAKYLHQMFATEDFKDRVRTFVSKTNH